MIKSKVKNMILRKVKKLQILYETKNMPIKKLACNLIQKHYNNIIGRNFEHKR